LRGRIRTEVVVEGVVLIENLQKLLNWCVCLAVRVACGYHAAGNHSIPKTVYRPSALAHQSYVAINTG